MQLPSTRSRYYFWSNERPHGMANRRCSLLKRWRDGALESLRQSGLFVEFHSARWRLLRVVDYLCHKQPKCPDSALHRWQSSGYR